MYIYTITFFSREYSRDTYSFSRIVNYTYFAVTQYSNGSIILTCDNPAKSISQLSTNCINIIGLCLLNFVLFFLCI